MAIAKVVLNGETKMDTTQVTVTAADLAEGVTALGADGRLITGSGDPLEMARKIANGSITSYVDDSLTTIKTQAFSYCYNMAEFICHNVTTGGNAAFLSTQVRKIALPRWTAYTGYAFASNNSVYELDLTDAYRIANATFSGCTNLSILVLRHSSVVSMQNINALYNTPFADGKAGGTLYVWQSLISQYEQETNWSTILGYSTNQILPIEGSIYETQYVDGTPIPTT